MAVSACYAPSLDYKPVLKQESLKMIILLFVIFVIFLVVPTEVLKSIMNSLSHIIPAIVKTALDIMHWVLRVLLLEEVEEMFE